MYYYQHHIGDFIKDTANLDDHQLATYLRMIWAYYSSERPISGEMEDVAFAMRSDEKTVRLLLRHFFIETTNGWTHARCDREIEEYRAKGEKARTSANARWNKEKTMQPQCVRIANASVSDANQEPITKNQEPSTNIDNTVDSKTELLGFDDFWNAYDKKVEKPAAEKSWKRIGPSQELIDQILIAAAVYVESTPEKTFRKNPSTWLNNKCWLDEVIVRAAAPPVKQATNTSFRERDAELARQRVAEISPRIAAKAPSFGGSFIESEISNVTSIASH